MTTKSKLELGFERMRPAAKMGVTEESVCSQKDCRGGNNPGLCELSNVAVGVS